jgi:8-oxo-dGTP pyrophosphatase MutT (NUDIX family)
MYATQIDGASLISCTIRHHRTATSTSAASTTSDNKDSKSSSAALAINKPSNNPWTSTVLQHSAICPTRYLNHRNPSLPYVPRVGAAIRFAVCVIVQCSVRGFLITRRAAHMRAFPGAWVFPGGRVDRHETAEDAARREVYEETGLKISAQTPFTMVCVFESTYPTLRMQTHAANYPPHPSNHDIIINYHAVIDHTLTAATSLQVPVFQPNEVDLACWLTPSQLGIRAHQHHTQFIMRICTSVCYGMCFI